MYVVVIGFFRSRVSPNTVKAASPPFAIACRSVAPPWNWVSALPALRFRLSSGTVSRLACSSARVSEPGLSARGLSPRSVTRASDQALPTGNRTRALRTRLSAAL